MIRGIVMVAMLGPFVTACVNVTAPSDPIVIELNVNIKQEVLYRLVASAEENIESNPEIF
ncbi:YnbE family lipoprotein [Croceicoccus sp. YJ47]|uniref:YnbE family lipoprotein n=1 Tax=Croceicoccus sp. YJ47 TaxID=2798724 RepID=UPI0019224955|nr:YnbE family lipoprotein [Croceicoccus sp. YJ47]QQN73868.1 YnbE family lipoprotein [Croceicoccus sp. YJ47]